MTPMDATVTGDPDQAGKQDGDARLVRALLSSPRCCRLVGTVAPEILKSLAGDGRLKGLLARSVGRRIQSDCFARAQKVESKNQESCRLDPALSEQVIDLAVDHLNQSLAAWGLLQNSEKAALLAHLAKRFDTATLGRALTATLQLAQEDGDNRKLLRDKLTAILEATDFGEMTDAIDAARKRLLPLWEEALEVTWSYPSKVVSILAALPSLTGLTLEVAARGLAPFNQLPPDMLVDVVAALIQDIDARAVGAVVNQGTELVRKLHVGSTLIGSPGRPALPQAMDRLMDAILDAVDREALETAQEKLGFLAEALAEKRIERLERRPEWNAAQLKAGLKNASRQARTIARQVRCGEALPSDETLAEAVAEGLGDLDAGELAEACNRCIDLAGRVMTVHPDLAPDQVRAFAEEIDMDAILDCLALASAAPENGNAIIGLAVPLIHSLADNVEAEPDSELAGALRRLGRLMNG